MDSQQETIENTSNSLVSGKIKPLIKNENNHPELNSSRRAPSNSIDYAYDEDDYKSMWADISQNTTGVPHPIVDEDMTEYSGIF